MRIWTSEHIFEHDWETVVHAAWRKYPNPMNSAITGIDVLHQDLHEGKVISERVIQSHFPIPGWVTKLTGFSGTQYSHEYTVIDPNSRFMKLVTRNLNGSSFMRVDEKLTYRVILDGVFMQGHPGWGIHAGSSWMGFFGASEKDTKIDRKPLKGDPSRTVLTQEAIVTVNLPAFTDYCEKTFLSVYQNNATNGRSGMEWVINHLKKEYNELSSKVSSEVQDMSEKVMQAFTHKSHQ